MQTVVNIFPVKVSWVLIPIFRRLTPGLLPGRRENVNRKNDVADEEEHLQNRVGVVQNLANVIVIGLEENHAKNERAHHMKAKSAPIVPYSVKDARYQLDYAND